MATGLMIAGGLVWVGSFAFSVINTRRHINKIFSDKMDEVFPSFRWVLRYQPVGTVSETLGGVMFIIGLIMLIIQNPG